MKLAARVGQVTPSLTLAIDAKAKAMKASGIDICSFSAGEPDFDTPEHIKTAAKQALDAGKTKYGPAAGEPKLRSAIAQKLKTDNHLDYSAENVLVTNGGKHSLFNLMLALLDPGDEVIIPAPYWVSYPEMVKLAAGVPVIIHTDAKNNYKITPDQLRQACNSKTRLFVLNSPSNPTGVVYTPEEIKALAEVVVEKDILVVSDEIYEKILYEDTKHVSIGAFGPEIFARTIISNGFAKAYSMTGWRIGYAAGPAPLIQAMNTLQSQSTSNPTSFAQYGALAALNGDQSFIQEMVSAFKKRHDFVLNSLLQLKGVKCLPCQGTFYIFPGFQGVMEHLGIKDDIQLGEFLIEKAQVAMVPGSAFGAPGHMRISFATSLENLQKAMERLHRLIN